MMLDVQKNNYIFYPYTLTQNASVSLVYCNNILPVLSVALTALKSIC